MTRTTSHIRIDVDPANPGQYFACCGLLELASRLQAATGASGWFEDGAFCLATGLSLEELIGAVGRISLVQVDPDDGTASPILMKYAPEIGAPPVPGTDPFELLLNWWKSDDRAITDLKVWAGTMDSYRIARAMQSAIRDKQFFQPNLLDVGTIAYDPDEPTKKVEPYYFDARRAPNAHSRDVGFAPNDLGMTTTAYPAVEFLCFVGLQRTKPVPADPERPRIFRYHLWYQPLDALLLPAATAGLLPGQRGYEFESMFRTGQKKHKAFQAAMSKSVS
ncbi:hypothetical protein DB346_12565 [Verrucomicrobia bacterium LW23]|nr:hypothetical protein DB346_12565 [Verrucomicrobia bacterium LW23]